MATPLLAAVTADTDITMHIRLLADALIQQYPLRREEIELCPSPFYLYLLRISSPKATGETMPRRVYNALVEATAHCTDGDIAKSNFVFENVRLNCFSLVPAYPSSLFLGNKITIPHDVVFTVLLHIHTFARLSRVHFKDLALELCSHITPEIVQHFSRMVDKASSPSPSTVNDDLVVPSIRMSSFGINVFSKSHISGTTLLTKSPSIASTQSLVSDSHQQSLTPTPETAGFDTTLPVSDNTRIDVNPLTHTTYVPDLPAATPPSSPVRQVSVNRSETAIAAPSTPLASKRRPIPTHSSSPLNEVDSSPHRSPSTSSLTKRLFESDISARLIKKTRIFEDTSNKEQQTLAEQKVVETSKKGKKLRRRANRTVAKNEEHIVPPMARNEDGPQTSPITKTIPGSFLSHGERLEGTWRKRVVREKENADVEKGSVVNVCKIGLLACVRKVEGSVTGENLRGRTRV